MRSIKRVVFGVVLCCVIALHGVVYATPWSQQFEETGVGAFDEMAFFMVEGLESFTGLGSYTVAGWTDTETPTYISATGPDSTYVRMDLGFTGQTPFTFDFFAFDNMLDAAGAPVKVLREAVIAEWTENRTWAFRVLGLNDGSALYEHDLAVTNPVPEPATMLLFGAGIAGLVAARRRRVEE